MEKQRRKLNLVKARRRVRMRSALVLTLGVIGMLTAYRALLALFGAPSGLAGWTLETLMTLVCFGGGSYLGLCVLDGHQTKLLPRAALSRAQTLWVTLTGVLAVCTATLAADVVSGLFSGARETALYTGALPVGGFLLTALKSALLAPVLEELFFRGYLLNALERYGKGHALAVSSVCFALAHAGNGLVYAALGALFGALEMKTGSLMAPMLAHGCYNLALLLASQLGLGGLLTGLTLPSCALRLGGCLALVFCLRRAWTARGTAARLQRVEKLTKKEWVLVAAAAVLTIAACVMG